LSQVEEAGSAECSDVVTHAQYIRTRGCRRCTTQHIFSFHVTDTPETRHNAVLGVQWPVHVTDIINCIVYCYFITIQNINCVSKMSPFYFFLITLSDGNQF